MIRSQGLGVPESYQASCLSKFIHTMILRCKVEKHSKTITLVIVLYEIRCERPISSTRIFFVVTKVVFENSHAAHGRYCCTGSATSRLSQGLVFEKVSREDKKRAVHAGVFTRGRITRFTRLDTLPPRNPASRENCHLTVLPSMGLTSRSMPYHGTGLDQSQSRRLAVRASEHVSSVSFFLGFLGSFWAGGIYDTCAIPTKGW